MEGGRQIMLSGATLEEVEVGDMKQKGASHQEMLKDASLKKSKLGNLSQE